jgi:uncharacterized membrane protein
MSIKTFLKLMTTGLVLSYPLLARWVLPHWHALPGFVLMLPPSMMNAWLAWIFGRTLLPGREPMIGTFARIERASSSGQPNADLPPELSHYTRALTQIWSGLFIAMALIATLLACSGMVTEWALFTGLISYALMTMLFLGEYLFRRLHFAGYPHTQPFRLMWFLIKSGPAIWMHKR